MPDKGASMGDARPDQDDVKRPEKQPQDADRRDKVQDKRMPDYEVEQREDESASVIERVGSDEGKDDGSDQVFPGRSDQ